MFSVLDNSGISSKLFFLNARTTVRMDRTANRKLAAEINDRETVSQNDGSES